MQVIMIEWWITKQLKTLCFYTRSLEINQWNVHRFTHVIYILAMCISGSIYDFHWPPMLEIGRWTRNVLTWVVWAPCTVGLVAGDTQCCPGACPTDGISIGFGFRSGFGMLWFGVCSADRGAVLHTPRPLQCRGVCEISSWSMECVLSRSAAESGRVSGSVGVSWVGGAPEKWNLHMYVNSHDQNIFFFFKSLLFVCSIMPCHVGNKLCYIDLNWNRAVKRDLYSGNI